MIYGEKAHTVWVRKHPKRLKVKAALLSDGLAHNRRVKRPSEIAPSRLEYQKHDSGTVGGNARDERKDFAPDPGLTIRQDPLQEHSDVSVSLTAYKLYSTAHTL